MARILGIDPGTKRCGIAVTDSNETLAFPRPAIVVDDSLVDKLRTLVLEEESEMVVIGRPLSLSGSVTESTNRADALYAQIADELPVPVVQWDERLTTSEAQRLMSSVGVSIRESRSRIDSASAVVLLQRFIGSRNV
jgi:putative Holliday junction resolvase